MSASSSSSTWVPRTALINLATNRGRVDQTLGTAGQRPRPQRQQYDGERRRDARGRRVRTRRPTRPARIPSPFNATNKAELFTSDGPRRMYFDFAGNFLPGAPVGNYTYAGGVAAPEAGSSPPPTAC